MGAPRFVLDRFWPSNLFLGGIPGAWYDPTDLSTMFQDSAGTTPVTAVEQPVGLILDKSQGLALGADVVANGDFSSGASWTLGAGGGSATIAAGLLTLSGGAAAFPNATQSGILTAGRWYRVTVVLTTPITLNSLSFRMGGGTTTYSGFTAAGTYTLTLLADGTNLVFLRNSGFTDTVNVDSVSVRELAGNHASQSTAASRPTYRARYNLLTYSEDYANAAWTKTNVTLTSGQLAPDGTNTAFVLTGTAAYARIESTAVSYAAATYTLSVYVKKASGTMAIAFSNAGSPDEVAFDIGTGTVGTKGANVSSASVQDAGAWWRLVAVSTRTAASQPIRIFAGYPTNISPIVWGAQLLTAADVTATGNAYQRIAAATVYDTAPIFRPYLAFDGLDDSLSTAAINFTSTDKMTVFAGETKLQDAALSVLAELSTDAPGTNGTFWLLAPYTAAARYSALSQGTSFTLANSNSALDVSPNTSVLTARLDIAAPLTQLSVNSAVRATNTASQGTGNYGNWPLFIGRRNNASFPFNGRLFSLIVRGAASSTTEIIDTETWVNQRTGAY